MKKITLILAGILCGISFLNGQCVYPYAGNGTTGYRGSGYLATLAEFRQPNGVAIDNQGNIYIADENNNMVWEVNTSGIISVIAGDGAASHTGDGGYASNATLNFPDAVAVDNQGNIYIAEGGTAIGGSGNNDVRMIDNTGIITTIAGTGSWFNNGDTNTVATLAPINPYGVAVDYLGNVYISDNINQFIEKVTPWGSITTIAGIGNNGFSGDGGQATAADLNNPVGVAVDKNLNVYVADSYNNRIRMINTAGIITTIAGSNTGGYSGDGGQATAAELNKPTGVFVDSTGTNIYIADAGNNRIRKVSGGIITTIAGNGTAGFNGDYKTATTTELNSPGSVMADLSGNIYFTDNNNTVREIKSGAPAAPVNLSQADSMNICYGSSTTLVVSGSGKIGWYSAATGGTYLGGGSILKISVTSLFPGSYKYYAQDSSACGISTRTMIKVVVNNNPQIELTSTYLQCPTCGYANICEGVADTLMATVTAGATWYTYTYTWTWDNGDSISSSSIAYTSDSLVVSPQATTGYSVTVTDQNGCVASTQGPGYPGDTIQERVKPATVKAGTAATLYCGASTSMSAVTTPPSPVSVTWSPSVNLSNPNIASPTASPNTTTTYTVSVTLSNGCSASDTVSVHVKPAAISLGDVLLSCGSSATLNAVYTPAGPVTVAWTPSTGLNNPSIANPICSAMSETHYTINSTYSNGCSAKDTMTVYNTVPTGVSICMVTVDTGSIHNIITWNKAGLAGIDSFKVYYYNSSNKWSLLASQLFSANSYYVDTASINDPNKNTVRYCVTAVDSCGHEEPFASSPWQNTMHILNIGGGTFSWSGTGYLIQGDPTPVQTYYLDRDNIGNGNWKAIDSVSGTQNTMTDPNYASYPNGRWRVEALLDVSTCTVPNLRPEAINYNASKSNTGNITITGVKALATNGSVSIYPNPAGRELNLKFNYVKSAYVNIEIADITGRVLLKEDKEVSPGNILSMNITDIPPGMYFIKIETGSSSQVEKFIKE
ncbi:MAG TPA: T9SS type A sorting domain-containing protein [Bacteroidia bacterium]|nr:T9SS type A sorting domain-containing protein [Bacteroidia bacterium]